MSELSNSVLPDVLVEDILERLPVKPIGRFRCVSKPWRSLLSSPKFLKSHHKLHIQKPIGNLTLRALAEPYIVTLPGSESSTAANGGIAKELQSEKVMWSDVIGSCNGLLLFGKQDGFLSINDEDRYGFTLINPITLETAHILDDRDYDMHFRKSFYGFGYDSANDDYKIVSLWQWDVDEGIGCNFVDVYSVRNKCWKRVTYDSPYVARPSVGVFLNGCILWFGHRNNSSARILSFDLAREEFVEGLCPPNIEDRGEIPVSRIKVFDGCLAMLSYRHDDTLNLWVMRKYGVQDSWTKLIAISLENEGDGIGDVVCELNEHEIVVQKYNREQKLLVHNWRNGTFRDLDVAGLPGGFIGRVTPFKGSLLSPNL